ncbi:Bromodomain containing protein, partial [Spraguea lophii 42_110]
ILYNGNSNDYNISNKELEYIINDNSNTNGNATNNINSITTTNINITNNDITTNNDLLQEEVLVNYKEKIKELLDIIINLRDKKGREIIYLFMMLPSSVDYPDYYQIIKNPISIECMKKKEYKNYEEFIEDIMLMIDNAKTYNIEGSIVYSDANIIKDAVIDYNSK